MSKALWNSVRKERDRRLKPALAVLERHRTQKDFNLRTSLSDREAKKWADFAQDLRDVTLQADPNAIVWPEEP